MFFTAFTKGRQFDTILSRINPSHASHMISVKYISILSCHQSLGLPNVLFPSHFRTKPLYASLPAPIRGKTNKMMMMMMMMRMMIMTTLAAQYTAENNTARIRW